MEVQSSGWKSSGKVILFYAQSYFISIATILGTGILGLPATLSKSGFYPFVLTFFLNFVMQIIAIYQMVDVLQYARTVLSKHNYASAEGDDVSDRALLLDRNRDESDSMEESGSSTDHPNSVVNAPTEEYSTFEAQHHPEPESGTTEPNFHAIAKLFMPTLVQPMFLIVIFFHFIVIIISYALAGSEAYAQIFGVTPSMITPYFTWILAAVVILGHTVIKPGIAVLTLAKGTLLFVTVVVTIYSGAAINNEISDDWRYTDQPLLMGIVALSGIILVMPMLFEKFEPVRSQMVGFRNSLIAGISTCFVLNVMWCWAVLKVVPQTYQSCNTPRTYEDDASATKCDPRLTLEGAKENGEISTVPLTKLLSLEQMDMEWIAVGIQVFIMLSITVSFLTMGCAMQHTVCGWVDDFMSRHTGWKLTVNSRCCSKPNFFWHVFAGLNCFTVVFLVAALDPKGFVVILERVTSISTNLLYGIFMFIWIRQIRSAEYKYVKISLENGCIIRWSHYVSLVYFSAAIVYDVITWSIGR